MLKYPAFRAYGLPKIDLSGCVFYAPLWRPDMGGATFISAPPSHMTCTVTGATWGSQGRTFNGTSDKITIPDHAAFDGASHSILAWVKITDAANFRIFTGDGDGDGNHDAMHFRANQTTGVLFGRVGDGAVAAKTITGDTNVCDAVWRLVAFTWDTSFLNLYVNGVVDATPVAQTLTPTNLATALSIGYWLGGGELWMLGTIGEVLIFSRALTAAEILRIYQSTKSRYT